ncbi:4-vinyl reductase [Deltaproteobacteria bacterium Smac51]|nr:4-vinyl reductase [Deltaproteobacteria bacterium Smac51]
MDSTRKYAFTWSLLGDIEAGRPNLGPNLRMEVYRLMQFCFRDVLEQHYGAAETDRLFYEAGTLAGREFYKNAFESKPETFNTLILELQKKLKELGMAILRVEETDLENLQFTLTMAEDLDCSGLPELGYEVCVYDEGFLSGILEEFTGRPFKVREVDCWCTSERTCRFEARPSESSLETFPETQRAG